MNQEIKNKTDTMGTIEAVVIYLVSLPLIVISLAMTLMLVIFIIGNVGYAWSSYDRASVLLTLQFALILLFDIMAIIRISKALSMYTKNKIKSYQYRIKAMINLNLVLVFGSVAIIVLGYSELSSNLIIPIILLLMFIVLPALVVRWRIDKNSDILRELIMSDIENKKR